MRCHQGAWLLSACFEQHPVVFWLCQSVAPVQSTPPTDLVGHGMPHGGTKEHPIPETNSVEYCFLHITRWFYILNIIKLYYIYIYMILAYGNFSGFLLAIPWFPLKRLAPPAQVPRIDSQSRAAKLLDRAEELLRPNGPGALSDLETDGVRMSPRCLITHRIHVWYIC